MADLSPKAVDDFPVDLWIGALRSVARHYRLPSSAQDARLASLWQQDRGVELRVQTLAHAMGLQLRYARPEELRPTAGRLPLLARLKSGEVATLTAISQEGIVGIRLAGEEGPENHLPIEALQEQVDFYVIPRPQRSVPDARVDDYIKPYEPHWLRQILLKDRGTYVHVLTASVVTNILGLATVLFSMQVYDRVVPAQSYPTLYILYFGVLLGLFFDFTLRNLRMKITDILGKRVDMRMSDKVFGHALRVRNDARPQSTGSFISQLRDLDSVREMLTSTTVSAVSDIPFFLLFLVFFWYIGGALVLVPMGALVLLLLPSLLAQPRLKTYASEAMRESALRNAMLVESVQGLEDIKSLQAENRFQHQWNHLNAVTGEAQLKARSLTNNLTAWAQVVQNGVYVTIILFGAPMVMEGTITTGTLVAASILGSRMMAPMSSLAQILNRLQQARMGVKSLNDVMALPVDNPPAQKRLHAPQITGRYSVRQAMFQYPGADGPPALKIENLEIQAGEKIALLGRNGAGKSTLLQALSGLMPPTTGDVLLDDMTLSHLDPADTRRDVGLLAQGSRLFHGTIRENLMMGAPMADDAALLQALVMAGGADFVRRNRAGFEYVVREGGTGLSGGQVQSLLLARLLVRQPQVLLLDEPTAAMDEVSERRFLQNLKQWSPQKTLVIATHRMKVLDIVDRIIIVQNGRITHDADKQTVLGMMQPKVKSA